MASQGNQHCANCIGTLSFPIAERPRGLKVGLNLVSSVVRGPGIVGSENWGRHLAESSARRAWTREGAGRENCIQFHQINRRQLRNQQGNRRPQTPPPVLPPGKLLAHVIFVSLYTQGHYVQTRRRPYTGSTYTPQEIEDRATAIGKKGKVFPHSLPSVGPGADPGVQAVSPQVT